MQAYLPIQTPSSHAGPSAHANSQFSNMRACQRIVNIVADGRVGGSGPNFTRARSFAALLPNLNRWPRAAPLRDSFEQQQAGSHATSRCWVAGVARACHFSLCLQLSSVSSIAAREHHAAAAARGSLAAWRDIASTDAGTLV